MNERARCFIAIGLGEDARSAVAAVQATLRESAPDRVVRWVDTESVHVTLKFLGEVDSTAMPAVEATLTRACSGVLPFDLALAGADALPNLHRPRVVWVGLAGQTDALNQLQARVEDAVNPLGFTREQRRFQPHLTLGRVRETSSADTTRVLGQAIGTVVVTPVVWHVTEAVLMRTTLAPRGAIYSPLARVVLTGALSASG